MEPRLRSRGSAALSSRIGPSNVCLQWSRGCEAAEADRHAPHARDPVPPSMEPRLRSRGSLSGVTTSSFSIFLQWSRGCEAAEARLRAQCRRAFLPSMEPRLRSRGSLDVAQVFKPRVPLQWSRGCEAAEAPARSTPSAHCRAFNGAAAAKPRKLFDLDLVVEPGEPSMEPRLRSRGSPRAAPSACSRAWTFNGAAAAKPRKQLDPDLDDGGGGLQWSRGCEAAEACACALSIESRR